MNVNPATAKHVHEYAGKKYYFCCSGCVEKFKTNPQAYLNKPASSGLVTLGMPSVPTPRPVLITRKPEAGSPPSYVCPMCPEVRQTKPGACPSCGMALEPDVPIASTRTEYTCPMHPEIVRPGPGSCPICGMALEPRTVTAVQEENPELRDMTRRFWVGVVLTAPLLVVAMGSMFWREALMLLTGPDRRRLAFTEICLSFEFLLATPVVLWCGLPFFQRFWTSLVNRSPNMFTLIGLGTGVAYVYSVVATLAPGIFPDSLRRMGGYPDVYFEAAAAITTLVLLGQVMELRARSRTSAAIRALLDLSPKTARLSTPTDRKKTFRSKTSNRKQTPRSSRRKSSRRWRRPRRPQLHRRVDDHRRIDPRRKIFPAAKSSAPPSIPPDRSSCAPSASDPKRCSPALSRLSAKPSAAALPSSVSPIASPPGSFPQS